MKLSVAVKSSAAAKVLVDVEVYSPSGQKVFQQAYDNQSFSASQTWKYAPTWQVPSSAAAGTYTIKVGIFSPGWGTLENWNDKAGTFGVT